MSLDQHGAIRPLMPADLPAVVAIMERRRIEQAREQPIFWRKAAESAARHAQHLTNVLCSDGTLALTHEHAGTLDGFILGAQLVAPPGS